MSGELQPGLAAWADIASVRRTVEWVGRDDERLAQARYTGAGLVRLLGRIAGRDDLSEEVKVAVERLVELWSAFDESGVADRAQVVQDSRTILDEFVSIGELGARSHEFDRKARLSKPSRRDRNRRKEKEGGAFSQYLWGINTEPYWRNENVDQSRSASNGRRTDFFRRRTRIQM